MQCDTCEKEAKQPNSVNVTSWLGSQSRLLVCDSCFSNFLLILKRKVEKASGRKTKTKKVS